MANVLIPESLREGKQLGKVVKPTSYAELWYAVAARWGIKIPTKAVCPGHCSPFQAFAHAFFAESPVAIWKASRGFGGKSTLLGTLVLSEAAFLGAQSTVLGGSASQSQRVHEVTHELWYAKEAPNYLLDGDPTKYVTRLHPDPDIGNPAGRIIALMASQKSVRGPHPQRLRLDEIDEMDLGILEAAQGQPQDAHGIQAQTVMSSTHQYPDGTMTEMLKRANQKSWPVFTWCIASGSQVLTLRGHVPIQEVTDDDYVATRQGWRKVQHVTFMGYKPTVALLVNGKLLRCTPDHRIATPDGWRHAGALAADTMASIGSDPSVLGRELVPLAAVGASGVVQPRPAGVLPLGDDLQVFDVDTGPVPAQVVKGHSFGDGPDHVDPDPSVSVRAGLPSVVCLDGLDPVPVAFGVRPVDACSGEHGNIVLPVWDIGVEGVHEFVVEGVVVHNCWRESVGTRKHPGWLSLDMVDRKRAEISEQMFSVEYDLQEPSTEGRAIQSEYVDAYFDPKWGTWEGMLDKEVEIWEPVKGATYVTGVDWAKEQDWTIIRTFRTDKRPWGEVAFMRTGRRPWPHMIAQVEERLRRYGGLLVHDATGIGNVVDDLLEYEREKVFPVVMRGRERETLFSDYIAAIEHSELKSARVEFAHKEHLYTTYDDLFGKGHPPDSVVAGALAWSARNRMQNSPGIEYSSFVRESPWRF